MGSDPIALPLLNHLRTEARDQVSIIGVFTQPDRPSGRGMKVAPNAIKRWAIEQSITLRQPEKCGPEDEQWLRDSSVDLVLVMAFGQLLRRSLIEIPSRGTVNFHASLLPKLRGASPIHTAIATGEAETGVTLMRIVPKLDAGPTLDAEKVLIAPDVQAPAVIEALADACVPLIARNLARLCDGTAQFKPQDDAAVTYCRRISRDDAQLDFSQPARCLHDRIRAFQPWPGAQFEIEGVQLKIGQARVHSAIASLPGEVVVDGQRVFVQCGDASLELLALQRPGGRMLPTAAFLQGFAIVSGSVATSRAMAPLVSPAPFPRK